MIQLNHTCEICGNKQNILMAYDISNEKGKIMFQCKKCHTKYRINIPSFKFQIIVLLIVFAIIVPPAIYALLNDIMDKFWIEVLLAVIFILSALILTITKSSITKIDNNDEGDKSE
ncbi:hypothetical protein DCO58_07495 [Helicobacter saguini]|uniref:Uncharacterized protein n=1 Tax=Helicobacter saguini TaxID=1548018 RepID=A0A347VNC3_9HELI|nr:hypothetical protein [Helicobacter saguini]MWV61822.1 hypothetical protein [Helicobacter saguini]MWV67503.1 hypothetical protein [Helicobacter saguini]MWV69854.1 hypothetical protein [Helicobacter saguini]MWV72928.1 hypothetical protein [Helicobacter saguini]TLD95688.1 hypothetical protein LS64_002215 [Helicobacter saguini]